MKKAKFILLQVLIALIITVVCGEIYLRSQIPLLVENQDRWYQPFVGIGDFKAFEIEAESPQNFGYEHNGLTYIFESKFFVKDLAERGSYLFLDRKEQARDEKIKRIFILGGSAALGDGASDVNKVWRYMLETELREKLNDPNIVVISAATRAFVTSQERLVLELFVLPLKPDAVVDLNGFNDANTISFGARPGDPFNQGTMYKRLESPLFQMGVALGRFSAIAQTFLWRFVYGEIQETSQRIIRDPAKYKNYVEGVSSVYKDNVTKMAKRCSQEEVPCFFMLQPIRPISTEFKSPLKDSFERIRLDMAQSSSFPDGAQFHDLSQLFNDNQDHFTDAVHFNDSGQKLMAQTIAGILLKNKESWYKSLSH